MAKPRTLSFGNFKVYLGDGASPEVFTAPCGFTQKSLTINAQSSSTNVPDCDDPEAVAWEEKAVSVLSAQVQGSGVMAMASLATWRDWALSGQHQKVRVEFADTGANGGGYYEGFAILTTLGHATTLGSDGNKVQLQVTLDSDGEWTWTDAA